MTIALILSPGFLFAKGVLPKVDPHSSEYQTPRAGKGFETEVLGKSVTVKPSDRTQKTAWDLGVVGQTPPAAGSSWIPAASLYLWRHPSEPVLFRGVFSGFYNQILYAVSPSGSQPHESVFSFENLSIPIADTEFVDGRRLDSEELLWGYVRAGAGPGLRWRLKHPGQNDNMTEVSWLLEPGYLYFMKGKDTAPDFRVPKNVLELRTRLRMRSDRFERNVMELLQKGTGFGWDVVGSHRFGWEDWGPQGGQDKSSGQDHLALSGYAAGATGVPFVENERHRLLGSLHAGTGVNLDRFSAFRVGGGFLADEYDALSHPVIPGARMMEFTTRRYAVLRTEYRWEAFFFLYWSLRSSVAYVDRLRDEAGSLVRRNDFLSSVGTGLTTGFFFKSRLNLDYNFNPQIVRPNGRGAHEVIVHISGLF